MNSNTLHIDELLNQSFSGFEPSVPAFAWEGITDRLDSQKRKKAIWWWTAAAALVLLVSSSLLLLNSSNENTVVPAAEHSVKLNEGAVEQQNEIANTPTEHSEAKSNGLGNSNPSNNANNASGSKQRTAQKQGVDAYTSSPKQDLRITVEAVNDNRVMADLYSLGIGLFELPSEDWTQIAPSVKLVNEIGPVKTTELGKGFYMGLGVGQLVTATGFHVNPDFGNYVHKNFTKRMAEGEGLLASLSFNASLGYRISKNHSFFAGVNYYQRKNSLNFSFTDEAPALDAVNNPPLDKFGRYPIKDYLGSSTVDVNFKGTNTFTAIDFPIGWMGDFKMNRTWSFVPLVSANLGMLNVSAGNSTLDYQFLDVVPTQRSWYKRNYVLMNTSAGIYKNIGQRIKWGVNATANYTVTQLYISGASIRPRAFTGGFTTQLIWRLD